MLTKMISKFKSMVVCIPHSIISSVSVLKWRRLQSDFSLKVYIDLFDGLLLAKSHVITLIMLTEFDGQAKKENAFHALFHT